MTLAVNACSPGEALTSVPTQALIPATPTRTPTPITPTSTPQPLPGPEDIRPTAPVTPDTAASIIDRQLVNLVLDDLAGALDVSPEDIRLVGLETATWRSADLECDVAGSPAPGVRITGFRLVLQVGDSTYEYHTDTRTAFRRCPPGRTEEASTSALTEVDPIAAELVGMAQRRVAQELDLPVRRIRLVEVLAITWTDSSLGCPLNGQSYIPVNIEGYRIVVAAGDEQFTFHTDTERLMLCDPEKERLPGGEATPEPAS